MYDAWKKQRIGKNLQSVQPCTNTDRRIIITATAFCGPVKCSALDIVQNDSMKLVAEPGNDYKLIEVKYDPRVTPASKEKAIMYFGFVRMPANNKT